MNSSTVIMALPKTEKQRKSFFVKKRRCFFVFVVFEWNKIMSIISSQSTEQKLNSKE